MNRRMVLKRLTSFSDPRINSCERAWKILDFPARIPQFVSNGSNLKWKRFRDLSRGIRRSVQRRSSILHPRLPLGSTAISRRLYVCTSVSYVEEYRDAVPAKTRQIVERACGGTRGGTAKRDLRETADPLSRS